MKHVSFHTRHQPWPYHRQVDFELKDIIFNFPTLGPEEKSDWLVVYDDLVESIHTIIPKQNRILFIAEPPSIRSYSIDYLNQFGIVVCPYTLKGFKGMQIISHTSLPWHFGIARDQDNHETYSFNQIKSQDFSDKKPAISVVCSNKAISPAHHQRLEFVRRAKEKLGDQIHVYGRGFKEINDKAEAIIPYQFHLVLENNAEPHFWTEKLADSYLGLAYPFFSGCSNIHDYFNPSMLTTLDIKNADQSIASIQAALSDPAFYQHHKAQLIEARERVMHKYNLFNSIFEIIVQNCTSADKIKSETIKPSQSFIPFYQRITNTAYKIKSRLAG